MQKETASTAYVALWFPKASETFVFDEVEYLRRAGFPVEVFTLYGRLDKDLAPEMLHYAGRVRRLGLAGLGSLLGGVRQACRRWPKQARPILRRLLVRHWGHAEALGENLWAVLCGLRLASVFEDEGFSHIHACWAGGPATAAWVASQLTGIPFSFSAHAHDVFRADTALAEKIRDCSFVRSENQANVAILSELAGEAGRDKLHVVHSGHSLEPRPQSQARFAAPYRIRALGRLVPKKGFDDLLRACRELASGKVAFELAIGGSGPEMPRLQRLCRDLALTRVVRFEGFVRRDGVPRFLADGDIFVMPSRTDPLGDRDGIPNVIVEAMLQGVPVVATNAGAIGEVVQDGVTGLLVPEGDPAALARAIMRTVSDGAAALERAQRARDLVHREFDIVETCRQMSRLFDAHRTKPEQSGGEEAR